VRTAFQRRNLANCQDGLAGCDPLELTETDLNATRESFRRRNVEACKRGLPACDPSLLTGPEIALVAAAFQQRHAARKQPPQAKP
jgi:hypothetical protein